MLSTLLEQSYWDEKVPTLRDLKTLGLQTSDTRFALLDKIDLSVSMWKVRSDFITKYGFAVPSRQMLERVAVLSKRIVEVGAGTGFMAAQLRRFEVDVVATDLNSTGTSMYTFSVGSHAATAPMEALSAVDAVRKYPDRDVFCSWPSLGESWLTDAAKAMQPGRLLFYIGEGYGGCTADDSFHELIGDTGEFEDVDYVPMAQFFGINDNLLVYRRLDPTQKPLLTA